MDPAAWLQLYLEEDLGVGDVTTNVLLPPDAIADARIVARARTFVAGLPHAQAIFSRLGAEASTPPGIQDGVWVDAGATLLEIEGPARAILTGERTALNLLARMCGIAAATRTCMESLAAVCSGAVVAATRKTTPGFRVFEKEAVAIAGGDPYRKGLWDVAMVKDNHREAAGGLGPAVAKLRAHDRDLQIVAEAESLDDVLAAGAAGADWVMIDNQSPEVGRAWAEALWAQYPNVRVEASGGITPERVVAYSWADRISLGWLTQNVPVPDLGLDWGRAQGSARQPEEDST